MPATTAAPVPYLNPAFDPNPPKPATSTPLEPEPNLPTRKPTQPQLPIKKPAPPKTTTTPASPKTPSTTLAAPKAPSTTPAPAESPGPKPIPSRACGRHAAPESPDTKATTTTLAPPGDPSTNLPPTKASGTTQASPKAPNPAHALGRRGEDLVAKYVQTQGLIVLCRNWRCREGEIDIVATDGHMVVICEVKTRTTDEYGTPADAMSAKKIRCIKAATNRWLREFRVPYVPLRYDLAEVWWPPKGKPHLQYRRDAF